MVVRNVEPKSAEQLLSSDPKIDWNGDPKEIQEQIRQLKKDEQTDYLHWLEEIEASKDEREMLRLIKTIGNVNKKSRIVRNLEVEGAVLDRKETLTKLAEMHAQVVTARPKDQAFIGWTSVEDGCRKVFSGRKWLKDLDFRVSRIINNHSTASVFAELYDLIKEVNLYDYFSDRLTDMQQATREVNKGKAMGPDFMSKTFFG